MGGPIESMTRAVQQHKKSGNFQKELKTLKNQNKMLYRISKKSGSIREIQKIKKTRKEASKETNSSSEERDSDSSLASNNI